MTTLTLDSGTKVFGRRLEDDKNLVTILDYEKGRQISFFEILDAINENAIYSVLINGNHVENKDFDQKTIMTVENARKFGIEIEDDK